MFQRGIQHGEKVAEKSEGGKDISSFKIPQD